MQTLSLSGIPVSTPPLPTLQSNIHMNAEPRVTVRSDVARVVRAIARFVGSEYEPGSAAGRWAIHETRRDAEEIDLEEASSVQVLDAIYNAEIRRRVYAPPAPRNDVKYADGKPMHCTAPREMVAHVVRVRPTRPSSGGDSGVRAWRMTFAWYLGKIPKVCETALLETALAASKRVEIQNKLQQARSDVERLRGNGRTVSRLRREAEAAVRALVADEQAKQAEIDTNIQGAAYRFGIRELARVIAQSPEAERAIFGELI
jgi:hypothetical protein